ncbi:DegT/DnrJ/EryC1/StrS family aminotransferase [Lysinibacter sp. HNR]|uniref:DegT/DnrJ/EryC1/StrS family aminotransferase n=1 Tax=Lysinibacter sp. HNR TaxID=3031408 RepID=UPI0024350BC5|nr:DegT/DnrJ/EryC1/StrS family aminotransferase [Lysinibacter sp. HNR]WGD38072.1 DegT/DnrJ/EryC1/StrS family aminotransferase [Lysinibacter sp. HNR]
MSYEVPFIRPVFPFPTDLSVDFEEIIESNWFTNFGPREIRFREKIADYLGQNLHAVTFNNATSGIIAALSAVFGPGDGTKGIIIPSFTFAAGALSIQLLGYKPLFIDIDADTLQPSVESAIHIAREGKCEVAGVLLCNTFGIGNPDISDWENLCEQKSWPMVVDSAAGFGSRHSDGTLLGATGRCEVFSFHATKPFAIGEGGAVVTSDPILAESMRSFSNFGFADGLGSNQVGINGKLQELNAALGLRQFPKFEKALSSRRLALNRYREEISADFFSFPRGIEQSSVCFASVITVDHKTRERARERLIEEGVEARTYYSPVVDRQPIFAPYQDLSAPLPVTEDIAGRVLSLPIHENMKSEDLDRVIKTLNGL